MTPHTSDAQLVQVSKMFLAYAAAFAPDRWLPRALIDNAPFVTMEAVAPYRISAVQLLIDQQQLLVDKDSRFVLVPSYARLSVRLTLPAGTELSSFYNGVEAVIYQALEQIADHQPVLELVVLLNHARGVTDRAVNRGAQLAFELCFLVGRTALLLEDEHAEHYLREALRLERAEQRNDQVVAIEFMHTLMAFDVVAPKPVFSQGYMESLVERCIQRFGVNHNVTQEARDVLHTLSDSDMHT